jgi:hypothetical protein
MVRAIAGVVVGYLVMSVLVIAVMAIAVTVLGAERAFKPNVWEPSILWVALTLVVGFLAAMVGGLLCAVVAPRGSKAPIVLAGISLLLGLIIAIFVAMAPPPASNVRPPNPTMADMAQNSRTPVWVALLNPLVAVAGIMAGAAVRPRSPHPAPLQTAGRPGAG